MRLFTLQNHPSLPEFHGQEHDSCLGKKSPAEIIKIFYEFHKKGRLSIWHQTPTPKPPKWFNLEYIELHWAVKFCEKKEDF